MPELSGAERSDWNRREFLRQLGLTGGLALAGTAAPALLPGAGSSAATAAAVTVLTHVTVIDATGAPPRHDMSVVITGDRIVAIDRHQNLPAALGARVVNLRGKFVVPGLWDMHVHTTVGFETTYLPLYVANGITGIREMWGFPKHHQMRQQITTGELLGPRMVIASSILDGAQSWPGASIVRTRAEAHQAVQTAKQEGADFVKIYSYLTRDAYFAIADEARRFGLPFAGHLPDRVSAIEASTAGHSSFEHLRDMFICLSGQEEQIRRHVEALRIDPTNPAAFARQVAELDRQAVATYSRARAEEVFTRLERNGTRQCPTLTVLRLFAAPAESFENDPRLKYLPPSLRQYWTQAIQRFAPTTPEQITEQKEFFLARQQLVGTMRAAGLAVLAGTDCANPYCFPGFSLHDELSLLVQAGLTPMQALQSATRYLGLEHTTGTVTTGKSADLLVLDDNPLDNITNTQKIHAIVIGGRVIDRSQREQILTDVEAAANSPTPTTTASTPVACPC